MEELNSNQKETVRQEPMTIPFGGRVCLGTGLFRNSEGDTYGGALDIGWLDHIEEVGKWLDESTVRTSTPIVHCVFPDVDSVDAMLSQLIILEYQMSKSKLVTEEKAFDDVWDRINSSFRRAMDRIEEIESGND